MEEEKNAVPKRKSLLLYAQPTAIYPLLKYAAK